MNQAKPLLTRPREAVPSALSTALCGLALLTASIIIVATAVALTG